MLSIESLRMTLRDTKAQYAVEYRPRIKAIQVKILKHVKLHWPAARIMAALRSSSVMSSAMVTGSLWFAYRGFFGVKRVHCHAT